MVPGSHLWVVCQRYIVVTLGSIPNGAGPMVRCMLLNLGAVQNWLSFDLAVDLWFYHVYHFTH